MLFHYELASTSLVANRTLHSSEDKMSTPSGTLQAEFVEVFLHPTAEVETNVTIGAGSRVWHHVHIREGVRIGENCSFGRNVYLDTNVHIGSGVKVQNGVSIYDGVVLEDDVFIGPHAVFTNDLYPRSFSKEWQKVPTLIKKGASVGANATILCGICIGEYAMIAAGTVVSEDVPPYALVRGSSGSVVGYVDEQGRPI